MKNDKKINGGGERSPAVIKRIGKILLGLTLTGVFSAVICTAALAVYAVNYGKTVNSDAFFQLAHTQDRTTHLYYLSYSGEDGAEVATELTDQSLYSSQNREWVKLENIPDRLQNAFIAIEDHRFYSHSGIDIRRTLGALAGYIRGSDTYGGSTITQQLIKNVTGNDEYSVSRKLHEIIFALKLDGELTKNEILELYLNTIYLSDGCYGVETAAERYFGKTCGELTVAECAALACIPQSPSKWNPRTNPTNNKSRRETVIGRMAELGYITESEKENALAEKVSTVSASHTDKGGKDESRYTWYTEAVIDEATALLVENGIAPNRQTASRLLYSGGLTVITAQNPKMQRIAEAYFENERHFPAVDGSVIQPECAAVVIDPRNGNILALVGGRGEKQGDRVLNYATGTRRSPGSSIKPLSVYAPAIDKKKITYGSVVDDTPYKFISGSGGKLRPWPQNSPRGYRGLTTVRDAVTRSVNTVSVKVLNMMDKEEIFTLLHDRMGMHGLVSERNVGGKSYTDIADSPLAHGQLTAGVSVKEITGAYTAIAGNGVYHKPKTVLKIFDAEGKLLIDNTDEGEQVFSPETAAITTKLLQGVTKSGTAASLTLKKKVACAGKTGTTGDNYDKWFIGYTPDLLCGVWFGYSAPKSLAAFSSGGGPAVKVWDGLMTELNAESAMGRKVTAKFPENKNIVTATYCRDSGKKVTAACLADPRGSRIETGYFTRDTVPRDYCDCHVLVRYDTVNHGVSGEDCPISNCRSVGLIRVKREFPIPVTISDAQYVYRPLDGHAPCLDSTEPFFLTA
ncbi:MAG: transglycosylase domain-containing protein, partial [Clostridia bacterium]|nr:transglycosylase domain-containing protein [Clostridia bacterium]